MHQRLKKALYFGMVFGFALWSIKTMVEYSRQQSLFFSPGESVQNLAIAGLIGLPIYVLGSAVLFGLIAWMVYTFEKF